jgi:RES domain-containing protein
MILYRLGGKEHAHKLDGLGAARKGQRWNPKDLPMLYTSTHRSLSFCEVLAHFSELPVFPDTYEIITYEVKGKYKTLRPKVTALPVGWNAPKPYLPVVQEYGREFYNSDALLLRLPSVVMPQEWNYLVNPRHAPKHVQIIHREHFDVDKRFNIFMPKKP